MEAKTLVLGVIGSDVHAVGNKILEISSKRQALMWLTSAFWSPRRSL